MYLNEALDVNLIIPGSNDRKTFNEIELTTLSENIASHGLLQPITVRTVDGSELYEIVAGERRYRAVSKLGWSTIPAMVADLTGEEASALMLAENTARVNLDPIEEAQAYNARINGFGWSVEECAKNAGVSRMHVQFRLKLLALRADIQHLVKFGNMPLGYAQIMADADLSSNRQMIALLLLQKNPSPTPAWFRQETARLYAEQSQEIMFNDLTLDFTQGPRVSGRGTCPPLPGKDKPEMKGKTLEETLTAHITYWKQASAAWQQLGKNFKRQECDAAASALQTVLDTIKES